MSENNTDVIIDPGVFDMIRHGHRGYMARWYHHMSTAQNGREAWEKTELELVRYFNLRRFTTYESFKSGKNQPLQCFKKIIYECQ